MERDYQLLKDVLSVPTKTYQEDLMVEFLINWLEENGIPFNVDEHNNIYAIKQTDEFVDYYCLVFQNASHQFLREEFLNYRIRCLGLIYA